MTKPTERDLMNETLVAALRAAGHEGVADQLRDRDLAVQLEDAGHSGLASALRGDDSETAAGGEEPAPQTAEDEAAAFLNQIQQAQHATDIAPISFFGDQKEES